MLMCCCPLLIVWCEYVFYIRALCIVSWCSFSPLFDGLWIMRVVRSHVLRRHTAPALCHCSTAHGDTTSASSAPPLCSCSTPNTTFSCLFDCFPLPHGYHNQLSRAANAVGGRRLARVTQFDRPVVPTKRQLVVWLRLMLLSTRWPPVEGNSSAVSQQQTR